VSALLNAEVGIRNVEKLISRFGLRGADLAHPSVRTRTRRRCTSFDFKDEDDDDEDDKKRTQIEANILLCRLITQINPFGK
jgi:hypothetical protein